jgi:hypothetical protein
MDDARLHTLDQQWQALFCPAYRELLTRSDDSPGPIARRAACEAGG